MKLTFKPGKILTSLRKNFPVSAVFCLALAVLYVVNDAFIFIDLSNTPSFGRAFAVLWLGLFAHTAAVCLTKRYHLPRYFPLAAQFAGMAAGFFFHNHATLPLGVVLLSLALCLHSTTAGKNAPIRLGQTGSWFFAVLGMAIVLYAALSLCVSAVFDLFLPDVSYRITSIFNSAVLYFSCLVFAPWVFLGGLPNEETPLEKRGGLRKISHLIMLPLYLLLLGVLLLYVLKILFTLSMPNGGMNAYAMAALSFFVYFHLLLTGDESKLARCFMRWGALLLLPVIAAQAVGIYIRAAAYGLTANRIAGIVWSILCIGIVLCALLRKRASWFFPAAAAAAFIFCCTPLNCANLARIHQEQLLSSALERNHMLSAQGTIISNPAAAPDDRIIIYSAVNYLDDITAPDGTLTHTLQQQLKAIGEQKDLLIYDYTVKAELLGFEMPVNDDSWYSHYYLNGTAEETKIDVRDFDYAELITLLLKDDDPEEGSRGHISCDTSALNQALSTAKKSGTALTCTQPVTLTLDGETCDLAPLLNGAVFQNSEAQLLQDCLTLPSGKVLRIIRLSVYDYSSIDYKQFDITLNAWLLTPEAAD